MFKLHSGLYLYGFKSQLAFSNLVLYFKLVKVKKMCSKSELNCFPNLTEAQNC